MNGIKRKIKLWNDYNNPLYYWWKVRKIFKRPKIHLLKGKNIWFYGLPCRRDYYNPIIDIHSSNIGWKFKYDEVRHEFDPYISICFFRRYHLVWVFNWITKDDKDSNIRSMATWEAILDYLYNGKTIEECINGHVWISNYKKKDEYRITIKENLKCYKEN